MLTAEDGPFCLFDAQYVWSTGAALHSTAVSTRDCIVWIIVCMRNQLILKRETAEGQADSDLLYFLMDLSCFCFISLSLFFDGIRKLRVGNVICIKFRYITWMKNCRGLLYFEDYIIKINNKHSKIDDKCVHFFYFVYHKFYNSFADIITDKVFETLIYHILVTFQYQL